MPTERFSGGAPAYAVYPETPEGRLAFANLQEFLPPVEPPRCFYGRRTRLAERSLAAGWRRASLCGGNVRFMPEGINAMLCEASLTPTATRGVRMISDCLPPAISLGTKYERIFERERNPSRRSEFEALARFRPISGSLKFGAGARI